MVKDVDLSALPIIDTQCDVYGIDGTAYIHEGEPDTTPVDTLPTLESSAATQSSDAPTPKHSHIQCQYAHIGNIFCCSPKKFCSTSYQQCRNIYRKLPHNKVC